MWGFQILLPRKGTETWLWTTTIQMQRKVSKSYYPARGLKHKDRLNDGRHEAEFPNPITPQGDWNHQHQIEWGENAYVSKSYYPARGLKPVASSRRTTTVVRFPNPITPQGDWNSFSQNCIGNDGLSFQILLPRKGTETLHVASRNGCA